MNEAKRVQQDGKIIENIMKNYNGNDGAHFGFIVTSTGKRQFCFGGRADLAGICLAEALANFIHITEGLDESYLDLITKTAREMLNEEAGKVQ